MSSSNRALAGLLCGHTCSWRMPLASLDHEVGCPPVASPWKEERRVVFGAAVTPTFDFLVCHSYLQAAEQREDRQASNFDQSAFCVFWASFVRQLSQ